MPYLLVRIAYVLAAAVTIRLDNSADHRVQHICNSTATSRPDTMTVLTFITR